MLLPTLNVVNQFGETSIGKVLPSSDLPLGQPVADGSIISNISGGSAAPSANTLLAISDKLPAKTGVTAIAALSTPVSAITITLSTSNTYSDAAVKAAVDAALVTVVADLQAQLTQMNAILAQLKVVS